MTQITKKESFITYLDERTRAVQENITRLTKDQRKDEADFEKIRANIFQMFKTIFLASARISPAEEEQIRFFDNKMTSIAETWKEALAKAAKHQDERRILQEQVKLEVMDEIRNFFDKTWRTTI